MAMEVDAAIEVIDSICETLDNITPPDINKLGINQGSDEENEEIGEETEMKSVGRDSTETSEGSVESGSEPLPACPHSAKFVNDLSEESEEIEEGKASLRRERRLKKKRKRDKRLRRCCSGCDNQVNDKPISPDLPSPLATSTGMLKCNVIKSFGEVVQHKYNSEEEINEAIQSYSTVGSRLANQNDQTLSDVDVAANKSLSECGSPISDPDMMVCDYSNSVGRKLANRNVKDDHIKNDDLDECIGGFLLDSFNQNLDGATKLSAMTAAQLSDLLSDLTGKLTRVNEELMEQVKENDNLKAEKYVITKHISQLSRMAQGRRANDNSAFRKVIVTRETQI